MAMEGERRWGSYLMTKGKWKREKGKPTSQRNKREPKRGRTCRGIQEREITQGFFPYRSQEESVILGRQRSKTRGIPTDFPNRATAREGIAVEETLGIRLGFKEGGQLTSFLKGKVPIDANQKAFNSQKRVEKSSEESGPGWGSPGDLGRTETSKSTHARVKNRDKKNVKVYILHRKGGRGRLENSIKKAGVEKGTPTFRKKSGAIVGGGGDEIRENGSARGC